MNIPLINTNDKESINTSLIAIKRATEELNNLIKIADEKMAQLDEKAKKYTDDKINALDVASVGGSGKYISAIEETDGKISATASNLDTTVTPSSTQPVTSGGVANYIISGDKNSPISDCNSATKNGIYYFQYAQNCPPASIGFKAPDNSGSLYVQAYDNHYICQMVQDYYDDGALYIRSCKGGTWSAWQRITANTDWESVVSFNYGSFIKGRIESGHRVLHLHFNGYYFGAGTLTFGYLLTNLPEAWRPSDTRRCIALLDLYDMGGNGVGRTVTDIDIYTSGNINLYPAFINQYSGTVSYMCNIYGDAFVEID